EDVEVAGAFNILDADLLDFLVLGMRRQLSGGRVVGRHGRMIGPGRIAKTGSRVGIDVVLFDGPAWIVIFLVDQKLDLLVDLLAIEVARAAADGRGQCQHSRQADHPSRRRPSVLASLTKTHHDDRILNLRIRILGTILIGGKDCPALTGSGNVPWYRLK